MVAGGVGRVESFCPKSSVGLEDAWANEGCVKTAVGISVGDSIGEFEGSVGNSDGTDVGFADSIGVGGEVGVVDGISVGKFISL